MSAHIDVILCADKTNTRFRHVCLFDIQVASSSTTDVCRVGRDVLSRLFIFIRF